MKQQKQQSKWHRRSVLALAVSAALQANAQEPASRPVTPGQQEEELEEIIVHAKFQQSLINRIPIAPEELPFSLNEVDRALLDLRNFTRPIDALTTLPNITIINDLQNTGTPRFLARGFEAPIMVDNRPQNAFRGAGASDDSFVERYEVLRGPASIALGPVGSGAVFNTVTKSPQAERFTDVEFRADEFGSTVAEVDYNAGSLLGSDVVSARISGAYRDFDFDANDVERKTTAIRPVVAFDFAETTNAKVSASYTENDINPNKGFPLYSNGEIPDEFDPGTFTGFKNGEGTAKDTYFDGEINHEFLDNLKLTVRGSHQKTDFDYKNTSGLYNYNYDDGGPGIGLDNPIVYSYSYRGATESENTFFDGQLATFFDWNGQRQDFVISGSYDEDKFDRKFSGFDLVGPIALTDVDQPRRGNTDFGELSPDSVYEGKLHSALAEAAIRPNDWVTIVGGLRYDDVDQSSTRYRRGVGAESGLDDNETTFRLGATAEVTDWLNAYASFAESFYPQTGNERDGTPLDPEFSEGYEVGVKGDALNGMLTFTAAIFRTDREHVAVGRFDADENDDGINDDPLVYQDTIGKARAEGFEWTSDFAVTENLNVNFNYGYTNTDILEAGDNEDLTASAFPENTASFYVTYELSGALQGLMLGGGARYVGDRDSAVEDVTFDDYTVTDVKIAYTMNNGLQLSIDVLNVTDEDYLESAGAMDGRLTGQSQFGAPRTAVFTTRYRF